MPPNNAALGTSCLEVAAAALHLHRIHEVSGRFPPFWELFQHRPDQLIFAFLFFHQMRSALTAADPQLLRHLADRVGARLTGKTCPTPSSTEMQLPELSQLQVEAFRYLGATTSASFDAFAAGELCLHFEARTLPPTLTSTRLSELMPEPDGPMFFCWPEFALLAVEMDCDRDTWLRHLPILLRAVRVFVCAYGNVNPCGSPPTCTSFSTYRPENYRRFNLDLIRDIDFSGVTDADQLDDLATTTMRFAMPAGM